MATQPEIKPLTGIRGLAAFWVMIYHYSNSPVFALHLPLLRKGYLCVDLFFVLSGFVLGLRYGGTFSSSPQKRDYLRFLWSRVARLYPAYAILTLLYLCKSYLNISGNHVTSFSVAEIIANALMIQSWGLPVRPIIYDSWSVSVEVLAYLIFPLLAVGALAVRPVAPLVMALCSAALVAFVISSGYGVNGPLDAYRDDFSIIPLVRCVSEFTLGLIAFRYADSRVIVSIGTRRPLFLSLLVLLLMGLVFDKSDVLSLIAIVVMVACLYQDSRIANALFGNRLFYHLGLISYSLYLLHPLIVNVAERAWRVCAERSYDVPPQAFVLGGVVLTWLASYASFVLLERPGSALLKASLRKAATANWSAAKP